MTQPFRNRNGSDQPASSNDVESLMDFSSQEADTNSRQPAQTVEDDKRYAALIEKADRYAAAVKRYARDSKFSGKFSIVVRQDLQREQARLHLTPEQAKAIEDRVLQDFDQSSAPPDASTADAQTGFTPQPASLTESAPTDSITPVDLTAADPDPNSASPPLNQPTELHDDSEKLQQYEQEFMQALRLEFPPQRLLRLGLQQIQQRLELSDAAVEAIELQAANRFQAEQAQYHASLKEYEQEFARETALGLPPSKETQNRLAEMQRSLGLRDEDVKGVEGQVFARFFMQPSPAEFFDSPATKITAANSPDALTEMPPNQDVSFISTAEMPPAESRSPFQTNPVLQQANSEVSLQSEREVDYTLLRDLLRSARWQEADEATLTAMLAAADRTEQGWLDPDSLLRFPCLDLQTIDRLWSYHSNGKFGFRAQWHAHPISKQSRTTAGVQLSRIAQEREHTLEFVKKVDWWAERIEFLKYYNQLTFSLDAAKKGHLPALWYWAVPWWKAIQNGGLGATRGGCNTDDQTIAIFMSRLRACGFE
ncbi:GUN4 domain-containing protein [Phormidium tenue FACHB-886]|nr:GUN4 domain-containing protein [Phormidium tenue FACHB-886]